MDIKDMFSLWIDLKNKYKIEEILIYLIMKIMKSIN